METTTDLFGNTESQDSGKKTRAEKLNDYDAFTEKFKPKKTTDDCYTPDEVYEAVLAWVRSRVDIDGRRIVRPFYPGGDYEKYPYQPGDVVIDNPPFSILSRIRAFYQARGIKYFLFAPSLTLFSSDRRDTFIAAHCDITYHNGANVRTSFVSNLFGDVQVMSAPGLYKAVEKAQRDAKPGKTLPKYVYPPEVLTSCEVGNFSKYGIEFSVMRGECVRIGALDSQRPCGKNIYGNGFLMSRAATERAAAAERAATERAAAERAAATEWKLSHREREMIERLESGEGERSLFD